MGSTLPDQLRRAEAERRRSYRDFLDFYAGEQWASRARRGERRLTVNYARVFIDKVTSYLMGGLDWVVDPGEPGQAAIDRARRAEDLLYRVAEENNLAALDFDTEIDTAVLGDGCYKVTWDPAEQRVRISAPDVQGLFAWWVGDDLNRVWRVASQYQLAGEELMALHAVTGDAATEGRGDAATRGRGDLPAVSASPRLPISASPATRHSSLVTEVWTAADVELWVDQTQVWRKPNPYGFIPFVIFPNIRRPKQFWGESDLAPLRGPARELNRALSALSQILELSGNPIAVLENVERADDIAVAPGAVWELPEKARAYLLDLLSGGGVKLHVDYLDALYRTLHDLAETPRTAFGDNQRGLSGVALEMELHPLLQKVRRKRLLRTEAYRRRAEMVLRLHEQFAGAGLGPCRVRVVWGPVLPQDRSRLIADERSLIEAGLHSRRRAMNELGVEDPDAELAAWIDEEARVRSLDGRRDG